MGGTGKWTPSFNLWPRLEFPLSYFVFSNYAPVVLLFYPPVTSLQSEIKLSIVGKSDVTLIDGQFGSQTRTSTDSWREKEGRKGSSEEREEGDAISVPKRFAVDATSPLVLMAPCFFRFIRISPTFKAASWEVVSRLKKWRSYTAAGRVFLRSTKFNARGDDVENLSVRMTPQKLQSYKDFVVLKLSKWSRNYCKSIAGIWALIELKLLCSFCSNLTVGAWSFFRTPTEF